MQEKFPHEIEILKRKQTNIRNEKFNISNKNTMERPNNKLGEEEERTSELEDKSLERYKPTRTIKEEQTRKN